MSFMITMKKNDAGSYDITATTPETLPDVIQIGGHVEKRVKDDNELQFVMDVVDLSVRCRDLVATASKREQYFQV